MRLRHTTRLLPLLLLAGCLFSGPRYQGPVSDHFDGKKFHNTPPNPLGVKELLRWQLNRDKGPWPKWIPSEPGPPPPKRVEGDGLRVTFINHATVLIQMDGVNILTDPIWSERASPVSFVGPKRKRAPGIRFEDLPPIDIVLISHNHYDHMDIPTLRRLAREHQPWIFAGLGNKVLLEQKGIDKAMDFDWWERVTLPHGIKITFVPSRHFSTRGALDQDATLWGSFVIEGSAGNVYFAGDTAFGEHFAQIGEVFGPLRLAILPIGAFRPRWFMQYVHIDPKEAVKAHQLLRAETSLGMHFGTFALADDGLEEPVEELEKALSAQDPRPNFWVLDFGEGRDVPPVALKTPPPEFTGDGTLEKLPLKEARLGARLQHRNLAPKPADRFPDMEALRKELTQTRASFPLAGPSELGRWVGSHFPETNQAKPTLEE